jgi:hypothetical protein
VKELTAQPASRLALTAALVEHQTIRIDAYEDIIGVDRLERDGHLYSDKAPGQPFLAAPFYAAARAVGADPASDLRADGNLTLWWVTLWSSTVPGALVVVIVGRLCRARHPADALLRRALRSRPGHLARRGGVAARPPRPPPPICGR